jgi:2-polyprenyl-3-methyl-5-hydroxy-6-metoxy-1,4-benzoquinol methylase
MTTITVMVMGTITIIITTTMATKMPMKAPADSAAKRIMSGSKNDGRTTSGRARAQEGNGVLNRSEAALANKRDSARRAFSDDELKANHEMVEARNAAHRRFGYDAIASVRFVLGKAQPLRGRVLDIGTGKGRFLVPLARQVAEVTTVDISPSEQRYAVMEAMHAGVADRIRFVIHDARRLPWPSGVFDAVVSWNVFHHLDHPERVLSEMIRMVRPNGKLVLADFDSQGFRMMDEIHKAEGRTHPHPPSGFPRWRAYLRRQGFTVRRFVGHHQEVLVAKRGSSAAAGERRDRRQLLSKPIQNGGNKNE